MWVPSIEVGADTRPVQDDALDSGIGGSVGLAEAMNLGCETPGLGDPAGLGWRSWQLTGGVGVTIGEIIEMGFGVPELVVGKEGGDVGSITPGPCAHIVQVG